MAEDLINLVGDSEAAGTAVSTSEQATAQPPTGSRRPAVHKRRFVAAFAVLALVIAAAGFLTFALLGEDRPDPFSAFIPAATDPVDRAQEIANFVQQRYLGDDGKPLVGVQAGETDNPLLPGAPTLVAVTSPPAELFAFEAGDILFFKLCPAGPTLCTLDGSADRATLGPIYAREALELALYGLKYVEEAESVMVILPTGFVAADKAADAPPRIAHYFRRRTLENKLDRPLTATLNGPAPTPATLSPSQVAQIDALTKGTTYRLVTTTSEDKTFNIIVITVTT